MKIINVGLKAPVQGRKSVKTLVASSDVDLSFGDGGVSAHFKKVNQYVFVPWSNITWVQYEQSKAGRPKRDDK